MVAEDGVHAGDLIRVKVVRDLEGAFAEGVDDGRWISAVREAAAVQQLAGIRGSGRRTRAGRKAGLGP